MCLVNLYKLFFNLFFVYEMINKKKLFFLLFILALSVLICPAGNFTSYGNHESAIDLNKNDACSHVLDDPGGETYKLIDVKLNNETELCCACNPGYKFVAPCSLVQRCYR